MSAHFLRALIASSAIVLAAAPALAHTSAKSTTPASGSVLPTSPEVIDITLNSEARLTSMVVSQAGKPDRKLEFMPSGSATYFMAHEPKLTEGRNEVKWKALSKDGHPVEGSIIIVIKAGATPSSPAVAPMNHDHH